ncbi:MAG: HD domain-containing protein, partial [Paracoccaceae bacterium]
MTAPHPETRLEAQMAFLHEADGLKAITRATRVGAGRAENSAEHSWHLALYALVLAEHAPPEVSVHRVIQMALLHDLVEIDAGDAPVYGNHDKAALELAESAAADRIFGLLPADQAADL